MNTLWSEHQRSLFPLRLLLLYALFIGLEPTIDFWLDFSNLEAIEEDWDSQLVFSVIVSVPLVMASWVGARNMKRLPILAVLLTLFTAFHLWTTYLLCTQGLMGEPYSDPGLSADAFESYAIIFGIFAVPFLTAYLIWFFWQRRKGQATPSLQVPGA
jgi:hypothetical protein